jgi:hypothetical protein
MDLYNRALILAADGATDRAIADLRALMELPVPLHAIKLAARRQLGAVAKSATCNGTKRQGVSQLMAAKLLPGRQQRKEGSLCEFHHQISIRAQAYINLSHMLRISNWKSTVYGSKINTCVMHLDMN